MTRIIYCIFFKHNNHRIFRKWGQTLNIEKVKKKTTAYVNKHGFDSFIRKTVISRHLTVPLFISPFLTEAIILLLLLYRSTFDESL